MNVIAMHVLLISICGGCGLLGPRMWPGNSGNIADMSFGAKNVAGEFRHDRRYAFLRHTSLVGPIWEQVFQATFILSAIECHHVCTQVF